MTGVAAIADVSCPPGRLRDHDAAQPSPPPTVDGDRPAPAAGVALVAAGAAIWGTDGALRAPLVTTWSPWTIVLFEHIILTSVVSGYLIRHWRETRNLDARRLDRRRSPSPGAARPSPRWPSPSPSSTATRTWWCCCRRRSRCGRWCGGAGRAARSRAVEILYVIAPAAVGTYLLSFGLVTPAAGVHGRPGQGSPAGADGGGPVGLRHGIRPPRAAADLTRRC